MLLNDAECYWLSLGRINDQWSWQSSPSYADYVISMIIISKYDQYADCVAAARAAPCSVSSHRLPQVPQVLVGLAKNGDLENEGNLLLIELMMFWRIMMICWKSWLQPPRWRCWIVLQSCCSQFDWNQLCPSSHPIQRENQNETDWLAVKSPLDNSQVPQPTCFWTFMAVGEPEYLDNGVGLQRLPTFKDPRSGRYWAREEKQEIVKMHPEKWSGKGICYIKGSILKIETSWESN